MAIIKQPKGAVVNLQVSEMTEKEKILARQAKEDKQKNKMVYTSMSVSPYQKKERKLMQRKIYFKKTEEELNSELIKLKKDIKKRFKKTKIYTYRDVCYDVKLYKRIVNQYLGVRVPHASKHSNWYTLINYLGDKSFSELQPLEPYVTQFTAMVNIYNRYANKIGYKQIVPKEVELCQKINNYRYETFWK